MNAASRWGATATTATDASPRGTSPVRWTIARRATPNRTNASSAIVVNVASAIGSSASYSRPSTARPACRAASASWPGAGVPDVTRVRPRKPTTAPSSGSASASASSARIDAENGASRNSMMVRRGPSASSSPPETGGIIATSSPSASGVPGSAYSPFRANRIDGRPGARTGYRWTSAVQAASTSAASGSSRGISRVPASSRCTANRRTRTRTVMAPPRRRTPSAAPRPDEETVADGQDRGGKARIGENRPVERPERGCVRVVVCDRPSTGDAATPQDVVGGHEGAGREARDKRLEVRLVFGFESVDERHVERTGQRRFAALQRLESRSRDDGDPFVGDAGLAPPSPSKIGPRSVGVDGDDRAVRRLTQCHPQRRVAIRRADLDDPSPTARQDREHPSRVAVDDRDAERLGRGLDGGERRAERRADRLDPLEVGLTGDPVSIVLRHQVLIRAIRRRNTDPPPGSYRRRWCRR